MVRITLVGSNRKMATKWVGLARCMSFTGLGTKKDCAKLIIQGRVIVNGELVKDPAKEFDTFSNLNFLINGEEIPYEKELYIAMNKPSKYEPLKCCGRLDYDTKGLILFSTNGQFVHHFQTSLTKTYRVKVKHSISDSMLKSLRSELQLKDGEVVEALKVDLVSENVLDLTIHDGLYHQVKRMIGAVSNRVEKLERIRINEMSLLDLQPGEWKKLTYERIEKELKFTGTYHHQYLASIKTYPE